MDSEFFCLECSSTQKHVHHDGCPAEKREIKQLKEDAIERARQRGTPGDYTPFESSMRMPQWKDRTDIAMVLLDHETCADLPEEVRPEPLTHEETRVSRLIRVDGLRSIMARVRLTTAMQDCGLATPQADIYGNHAGIFNIRTKYGSSYGRYEDKF